MTRSNGSEQARREWLDEAESALEKAGDALRAAWDESREPRMAALESAKQVARQLADAVDRGFEVARGRLSDTAERADREPVVIEDAGEAAQAEETLEPDQGQGEGGL